MLLGGAACAVAFAAHAAPSEASCIAQLSWRTYSYMGVASNPPGVKIGAEVPGMAKVPSCNDVIVNGYVPPVTYSDVPVAALQGIPPSIALAAGASSIYVNTATFPQLPSHPLHWTLRYNTAPEREVTGPPCQIKGVAKTDSLGLTVNGARILVGKTTKVELQRHGTGFVPPGTTIRVGGSACARQGIEPFTQVVIKARRIARG